ncbi:response regulator transcription factor [uncultured Ferrimonas sp.]|uniref:response regulator transcription factor n=1 Tax=uncultured Ferrimonas sp. TaxID=432640 RepID=UPI0026278253|nr:response regulator transcription factor [uncultured Ferrimonas sp.]
MIKKMLLVEDNRDVAGIIFDHFECQGVEIDYADNGELGLKLALEHDFDVIVLDLMMPRMDGLTVCRHLREQGCATPVLMLTALSDQQDTLTGYNCGADDYLSKPFDLSILQAHLTALTRRYRGNVSSNVVVVGDLKIEPGSHSASRAGVPLALTPTTFKILLKLARSAPEMVTRDALCQHLWPDSEPNNEALRSHIYQLRNQLDRPFESAMLHTIPKIGFQLSSGA